MSVAPKLVDTTKTLTHPSLDLGLRMLPLSLFRLLSPSRTVRRCGSPLEQVRRTETLIASSVTDSSASAPGR